MTDGELLASCRQGDSTAFAELVGRYRNRLWSICFRVTGNREDAEVAVQETLTSTWQNLHKFRGDAQVSTWLSRIAANASLAVVRERKNTSADADVVGRALSTLPEDFRVAITLAEFADFPYTDIAAHQGVPAAPARTRLYRARQTADHQVRPSPDCVGVSR
ncbi:RNA polymerase sigma factor [Prescottella agglutinans]|uniref:DNA-directed RNA polymerase specialized sigma24 family protein n=1 Tax=Prescottella agglutinans TaxID=1644129 RepID=A0ABT6MLB0_9NOCA|nr:sigma factor [Prescottella agglutinans]MDH6284675.1 DNA-directed RNA polymerase specialized sigma24 family protein [Prescottella agglutinans]